MRGPLRLNRGALSEKGATTKSRKAAHFHREKKANRSPREEKLPPVDEITNQKGLEKNWLAES